jgi:hypothetical protein
VTPVAKQQAKANETQNKPAKELNPALPLVNKPADAKPKFEVDGKIGTHNGAATDKYNWSQSIQNVEVQIELPKGTSARQLVVEIKQKNLKVLVKGETFISGELCEKVKVEDCLWSVED